MIADHNIQNESKPDRAKREAEEGVAKRAAFDAALAKFRGGS